MNCPSCNSQNESGSKFCSSCGFNLFTPADSTVGTSFHSGKEDKKLLGSMLGDRFLIQNRIAKGGMGIVYKAKDLVLDEIVALKILKPDLAIMEEMISRFKREIKVARKIKHPNVCSIYDFGKVGNVTFISMEYLEGKDLNEFIKGALPADVLASIVRGMIHGLDAAHKQNIIHRDLKPSNVIVDEDYNPVILDFGIARFVGKADFTQHKEILGTPNYMSPEQFENGKIDQRTDIYALGIIMYELFTGVKPFTGDTPISVAMQHIKTPPKPPREINKNIPEHIQTIILKCLEKNPDNRYQHVGEILQILDAKSAPSTTKKQKIKILIADDDPAIRNLLIYYLDKNGYDTALATNGEEAIAKSMEENPDLICMDLMMPKMDGYQAAEFLKRNKQTAHIPIVMITAKDDKEYKTYSKTIGIKDYIPKPLDMDFFIEKIKSIIPPS